MACSVSLVIPTYNAELDIQILLESIECQSAQIDTVVVIDSTSTDRTIEICKSHGLDPIVIPQSEFDHGGTRNLAIKTLDSDIVVMLTQDAVLASGESIKHIVDVFDDRDVAAACGRQLAKPNSSLVGRHLREYNYPSYSFMRSIDDLDLYGIKTVFLSDSFSAYRLHNLKDIGFFKDNVLFGEDSIACASFIFDGKKVAYVSEATVFHSHDYTLIHEFKRSFDIGAFHSLEKEVFSKLPSAENEGKKYLISLTKFLFLNAGYAELIRLPIMALFKTIGYKLGKKYNLLPIWVVRNLSMAPWWWDRQCK